MKQKQLQSPQISASRLPKWDNLKGMLILMVVVGHFIQDGAAEENLSIFRGLFLGIYSFHIPMFIFIMGLFYKRSRNEKLKTDRICFLLTLYILMKAMLLAVKRLMTGEGSFHLLTESGTPWYMFAAAVYMWLAYILRYRKPQFVLTGALLLGILVGYDKSIGDYLVLSRIIVFAPFFFLGYYLEPEKLTDRLERTSCKVAGGAILFLLAVGCILYMNEVYEYRSLMTGRNPYADCKQIADCGGWDRLLIYGLALLAGAAAAVLMPNKAMPLLEVMGQRSLVIYFWHRPVLYILDQMQLGEQIRKLGDLPYQFIWIGVGILLTLVLSVRIFDIPLQWLNKACRTVSK